MDPRNKNTLITYPAIAWAPISLQENYLIYDGLLMIFSKKRHRFAIMGNKPRKYAVYQFRHSSPHSTMALKQICHEQQTKII